MEKDITKEFKDIALMSTDFDLDALRDWPAFRALLADLGKREPVRRILGSFRPPRLK
jgi:hypothetical protein